MKIKTLVVDDELLGRKRIQKLLEHEPDIEMVGEASNGLDAIGQLKKLRPNLLFLDIQMPELTGFEMLAQLSPEELPVTIFVTAYDQHALQAFNSSAIDYLLKPFDDERFATALDKARTYLKGADSNQFHDQVQNLLESIQPGTRPLNRIAIKDSGRIIFLKVTEIDWIEAIGNYIKFHVGKESYMLRGRIAELQTQLNPTQFFRIHRSTIVNLDKVKELALLCKGEGVAILYNAHRLNVSRHSLQELQRLLNPKL